MADENKPTTPNPDTNPTASQQRATAEAGRTSPNAAAPSTVTNQNLNASASPGGDGVQSSDAERRAAGLDAGVNQPAQQRVNAALRREAGAATTEDDKAGERASVIQSPGEVAPTDIVGDALAATEARRLQGEEDARKALAQNLPQSTLDEIEAGRAALQRHNPNRDVQPAPSRNVETAPAAPARA